MSDLKDELLLEFTQEDIEAYCSYLDACRDQFLASGNLFEPAVFLQENFGLTGVASFKIFSYWASTFQNYLKASPDQKRTQNL